MYVSNVILKTLPRKIEFGDHKALQTLPCQVDREEGVFIHC